MKEITLAVAFLTGGSWAQTARVDSLIKPAREHEKAGKYWDAAYAYPADGRLVYAGELKKGENRISLGQGVYMWRAGDHGEFKGKAVVR